MTVSRAGEMAVWRNGERSAHGGRGACGERAANFLAPACAGPDPTRPDPYPTRTTRAQTTLRDSLEMGRQDKRGGHVRPRDRGDS
jgi:hypothetical protein